MRNFNLGNLYPGSYILRMSPSEIHCREEGKPFSGYRADNLSSRIYKVGWCSNSDHIGNGKALTTLISMSDGMVVYCDYGPMKDENGEEIPLARRKKTYWQVTDDTKSLELLCNSLNHPQANEYRFATQEELMLMFLNQTNNAKI